MNLKKLSTESIKELSQGLAKEAKRRNIKTKYKPDPRKRKLTKKELDSVVEPLMTKWNKLQALMKTKMTFSEESSVIVTCRYTIDCYNKIEIYKQYHYTSPKNIYKNANASKELASMKKVLSEIKKLRKEIRSDFSKGVKGLKVQYYVFLTQAKAIYPLAKKYKKQKKSSWNVTREKYTEYYYLFTFLA